MHVGTTRIILRSYRLQFTRAASCLLCTSGAPSEILLGQGSSFSTSISAILHPQAVTVTAEGVIGAVSQAELSSSAKWGCSRAAADNEDILQVSFGDKCRPPTMAPARHQLGLCGSSLRLS